jgi:hypothetical protein
MLAGDAQRRNITIPVPDPPLSFWSPEDKTQVALSEKAIGFTCLGVAEGALKRHFLPPKSFIDSNCIDGLRLELQFPSCWNGRTLHPRDIEPQMAYPDLLSEGECPNGFNVRLPALYFETIWATAAFRNASGRFLLSNGDDLGLCSVLTEKHFI